MGDIRAADILRRLNYPLKSLEVKKSVGSTNDEVLELFDPNDPEPVLCVSEKQTQGRGSFGKSWSSPAGGLYFSFAFVPRYYSLEQSGLISLITSLCLSQALEAIGLNTKVKWPNDIVVCKDLNSSKLSGMLLEHKHSKSSSVLLIGIGINIHAQPLIEGPTHSLPAISLEECGVTNLEALRSEIVASFLNRFFATQEALEQSKIDTAHLIEQYNEKLLWRGDQVDVFSRQGNLVGKAELIGAQSDGSIELMLNHHKQCVYSTEVSLRK